MAAGEIERARTLGDALAARSLEGVPQAEVLMYLSELESARLQDKVELRRRALREHDLPDELRLQIHQRVALDLRFLEGRSVAEEHARAAVELADRIADDTRRAGALAVLAMLEFQGGEPGAIRLAEQAAPARGRGRRAAPSGWTPRSASRTPSSGRATSSGHGGFSQPSSGSGRSATSE